MKVLYLTGMVSTKYGGLEKFNVELLRQNVKLSLVYESRPLSDDYIKDLNELGANLYILNGGRLKRIFEIIKLIRSEKPRIVHYHFGVLSFVLIPLVSLFFPKIKQIQTLHCEIPDYRGIYNFLFRLSLNCLDLVVCVSKGVKKGLVEKYGDKEKYIVSYLGVEKKPVIKENLRNELIISSKDIIVTSIGWDIKIKGFDILVNAVSLLYSKYIDVPRFKIIVIGLSSEEDKKFRNLLKFHGVSDLFLSVGIRNDIDDFLNISDIYVQTSRTEAISLSIMEALMYGLPIVGSNVGGIPEVCFNGRNGCLLKECEPQELADALYLLLCNSDLRQKWGNYSRILSEKFNLKKQVNLLSQLYDKILKE